MNEQREAALQLRGKSLDSIHAGTEFALAGLINAVIYMGDQIASLGYLIAMSERERSEWLDRQ